MEIKKDLKNELFKRHEIEAVIESDKNPGFVEVKKMIASETSKPEENIDVYNIKSVFGRSSFKVFAYVYDSKEDLEKAIQKTQKQRKEKEKAAEETKKTETEKPVESGEKFMVTS